MMGRPRILTPDQIAVVERIAACGPVALGRTRLRRQRDSRLRRC